MSEADSRNIVLTGFMGTGKSTVGVLLAGRLGRVFVDMDEVLEHRVGLTIPHIFATYGEAAFRAIEKGIAHELMLRQNLVIATGGGALLDADSREFVQAHAFVICLNADSMQIETRLAEGDGRPLASNWRHLLAARQPIYASLSRQIDTTQKTPAQVAEEIEALWQNA